jgi:demethylmenaquinone methyltransferase/2-methoxy-6-polyprenyl-1,4-benzoquinol methylase
MQSPSMPTRQQPEHIQRMFNDIAPTYDVLNHVLSFGLDIRWRKKAIGLLEEKKGGMFLDIAAGSGDLSLEALRLHPRRVIATDFAETMLHVFKKKLLDQTSEYKIDLVACDALHLPFRNEMFDVTMVAFGIRNFADRFRSLKEMYRVLKPSGVTMILELSKPRSPLIASLYTFYSRWGVPLFGKIISGHSSAYAYLPDSIANFPVQGEFLAQMREAGFTESKALSLTFGAATIYLGKKE